MSKQREVFFIWKKYGVYSYWDCVAQRLFEKYRTQHSNPDWLLRAMSGAFEMHFKQIKRLSRL